MADLNLPQLSAKTAFSVPATTAEVFDKLWPTQILINSEVGGDATAICQLTPYRMDGKKYLTAPPDNRRPMFSQRPGGTQTMTVKDILAEAKNDPLMAQAAGYLMAAIHARAIAQGYCSE